MLVRGKELCEKSFAAYGGRRLFLKIRNLCDFVSINRINEYLFTRGICGFAAKDFLGLCKKYFAACGGKILF